MVDATQPTIVEEQPPPPVRSSKHDPLLDAYYTTAEPGRWYRIHTTDHYDDAANLRTALRNRDRARRPDNPTPPTFVARRLPDGGAAIYARTPTN